jgi:hypothetical protein
MAQSQEQESASFGLPEIWNDILSWTKQHAVTREHSLIIDTCRLLDHETSGLGTVLQHLITDTGRNQLLVWADHHPTCAGLCRLAEACYKDPTPIELHKPLPCYENPENLFNSNLKTTPSRNHLSLNLSIIHQKSTYHWFELKKAAE